MFHFDVNNNEAVLDLNIEKLDYALELPICFHNNPSAPTDTIYLILPAKSPKEKVLHWHSTTSLTGPTADLIILTQSDLNIHNVDFKDFHTIMVSDNKFHHNGKNLIIKEDEYNNHNVTLENCKANNAHFLCNNLKWFGGLVREKLSVQLHGDKPELQIEGTDTNRAIIGNLSIFPSEPKLERVSIVKSSILYNFSCEGVCTLSIKDLRTGEGICRLKAIEIEALSNFQTMSDELIIIASFAKISSFVAPRAKVRIEVDNFFEFTPDNAGVLKGIELHIDVSRALDKDLNIPYGTIEFNKIFIKGAKEVNFLGTLIVEEAIIDSSGIDTINKLSFRRIIAKKLEYKTTNGIISFHDYGSDQTVTIGNLWLYGNIRADFRGASKVTSLETDKGRCQINIYNDFKADIVNLNLNLDRKKEIFDSENQGYFGIHIKNNGNHEVIIDRLLAQLTELSISGSVKLGKVLCVPIDSKYNLIQIDARYFGKISIEGFFVGNDYEIVINKTTGQISLVQSTDRMITNGGNIFAVVSGSINKYMTIRAGQGLSFHGGPVEVDGDVALFALLKLYVSGKVKSKEGIIMESEHVDVTGAELNAKSVITYGKTESYIYDSKIDALQLLSTTIGRYVMLNSEITATNVTIISENDELLLRASRIHAKMLKANAKKSVRVDGSEVNTTEQNIIGENGYIEKSKLSGENIKIIVEKDAGFVSSHVKANNVTNQAGRDIRMIFSQTNTNYLVNEANGDISIRGSRIISNTVHNKAAGSVEIASGSEVVTGVMVNESGDETIIKDSSIYGTKMLFNSNKGINIDNSLILGHYNIFLYAVKNFLSVNNSIILDQYPYKLFLHKGSVDERGNRLIKCGFSLPSIEAIGIIGQKGLNLNLSDLQVLPVDSRTNDLGIFSYLANEHRKAIIIDAATGVIIGSSLSAKNHQVIIKAKHGIELLPLNLYNAVMFSGGFNTESVKTVITKIEAGLIDLDGGSLIKSVGAYLRAAHGSLKADYIIDEALIIKEASAKNRSLQELSIWLGDNQELYDLVVNSSVVPTRLEFSEVTKIDVGKGKVNLFYPYKSKEVQLRQRQGDVTIDRDVHFPNQVMALHVDQGKIFFGIPKTESMLLKFFKHSYLIQNHTTEHVKVSGQELRFSAGGDVELHGTIQATNLGIQSGSGVKVKADIYNFGKEVKQSVIKADNVYITADNIEVQGSVITIKNNLKLVSHNDIKIIPIELIHRYSSWCGDKTFTKEMSIKQIVSEINAGIVNIDAGRAVEFIGSLIKAEGLNIKAKDLKIAAAKEIFNKQIEFKGKKKWYGGRNSWTDYTYNETVIPTEMHVGNLKMIIDQNATIEASQIFVKDEVLTTIKGDLVIRDGYTLHIHDHHAKKYSVLSSNNGSIKIYSSKSIKDFTKQTEGIPTLVCAGGIFYGIVDGRMHVLGSTIIGKDIHLVVPNGLKLEASEYTDKNITFVSETGAKLGFYCKGKQEFGIKMGVSSTEEEQEIWNQHLSKTVISAQDTLSILVRNDTFEQISSDLAARIIYVEARNWVAKTYNEQVIVDYINQHVESGVKIAIKHTVTSSIDKAKTLINKKGAHVVDNLDRIFKAYDTYKSFAVLPSNAATGGSYAYVDASQTQELTQTSIAVDNTISGETIVARIKEDVRFEGVQMTGKDVDIAAENFTFETSKDTQEIEHDFGTVDIDVGISNPALSTGGGSNNRNTSSSEIHHQNYIKVSGNLKITLASDGKFKGVSLEGASVDIKAKNLILESVQDIITTKLSGANFHVGLDQQYGIQGFSGYAEKGSQKSAWSNQIARIIGTQVVNIVVKETLELAGSLIANSEEDKKGNLTDKGNLSINCGRMIVKTIHDYDNGLTLGIGTSFQVSQNQEGRNTVSFHHVPLKVQFKDHKRTVASTVGQGAINTGSIIGDPLNRDITRQVQETKKESAEFDAPIHADMAETLTSIKQKLTSTEPKDKLPALLAHYFHDVADNFKGAMKDSIVAGAQIVNSVGGKVDTELLEQRMEQLFDWQHGAKVNQENIEQRKDAYIHELAKTVTKVSIEDNLDLSDEEQYKDAINKAKYYTFFEKLRNQLESDDAINAIEVSAALKTYQAHYLKELKAAKEEGRPLKEFGDFIKEVNRNHVYMSNSFAEKIHTAISRALGEVELMLATAPNKDGTINNVMLHALAAAVKEVQQGKARTDKSPKEGGYKEFAEEAFKTRIQNLVNNFLDPKSENFQNVKLLFPSILGEMSGYAGDNVVYAISQIPGGKQVLEAMGSAISKGLYSLYSPANEGEVRYWLQTKIIEWYKGLPNGMQILGQDFVTLGTFKVLGKVAAPLTQTVAPKIKDVLMQSRFWETNKLPAYLPELLQKLPESSIVKTTVDLDLLKPFYKQGAAYFDKHIDIIGEAISKKLTKDELFKIIPKEFETIIKVNAKNIVTGIRHAEGHHILPKEIPEFKELFVRAELNIKTAEVNSLYLPDATGKSLYPTNKSQHTGMHSKDYYSEALKKTQEILDEGRRDGWNASQYQKELLEIIKPMRAGLNDGSVQLNKAKPLHQKINLEKKP